MKKQIKFLIECSDGHREEILKDGCRTDEEYLARIKYILTTGRCRATRNNRVGEPEPVKVIVQNITIEEEELTL